MSAIFCFALFLGAVILSLIRGIDLVWAVLLGMIVFTVRGLCKGYSMKYMARAAWEQERKLLSVIVFFILIGGITAAWRSGGTIAYFIYYGVQIIRPKIFILVTFLLSAILGYTLGTSFGVVGTAGIILVAVARGGGVSEVVTAGAVLSGAYFGDRGAPASSSAATVAAVTGTELVHNVRQMMKTAVLPFGVSLAIYALLSLRHPITAVDATLLNLLSQHFVLSFWVLLPALLMLILPLIKVPVKWAMGLSMTAAFLSTVLVQRMGWGEAIRSLLLGYEPAESDLSAIISGGGVLPMLRSMLVIWATGLYTGVLEGTEVLGGIMDRVKQLSEKIGLFPTAVAVSLLSAAIFCNQMIVIVLGEQLLSGVYEKKGSSREELAIDIENSGIVLAPAIPWNIAGSIPLGMMGVSAAAIPYAVLLYMIPLCYGLTKKRFYPQGKGKV